MLENIKIIRIDKTNRDTSENKEYLRQYYAVRAEAFEDNGYSGLYDGIETEYDADKNTIIFLALKDCRYKEYSSLLTHLYLIRIKIIFLALKVCRYKEIYLSLLTHLYRLGHSLLHSY